MGESNELRIRLDKVDRKFIKEIKERNPEYSGLELYQVAKIELRNRLFEEIRKLRRAPENPGNGLTGISTRGRETFSFIENFAVS